jgi:hypothetical protein
MKFCASQINYLGDARISSLRTLSTGSYGLVLHEKDLMVCKGLSIYYTWNTLQVLTTDWLIVLSVYSKTGGKNGKHAWVETVESIGSVSYLAVQVWQYSHGKSFRTQHMRTSGVNFHIRRFAHLPGYRFLTNLLVTPKIIGNGDLQLENHDYIVFRDLQAISKEIQDAVQQISKQKNSNLNVIEAE